MYMCCSVNESEFNISCAVNESCYRAAKTHEMPYLYRSFSTKEPYNQWLFYGKRPATQGILSIFTQ